MDSVLTTDQIAANISNVTANNSTNSGEIPKYYFVTNGVIIFLSTTNIVFLVVAITVINKCKNLPIQVKWFSKNFLISGILSALNIVIMSPLLLLWGQTHFNIIYYLRVILASNLSSVSWASTVLMALERFVALSIPLRYHSFVKKQNLLIMIIVTWILNFALPLVVILLSIQQNCNKEFEGCDMFVTFQPLRIVFGILLSLYLIFNLISYIKISRTIKKHAIAIIRNSVSQQISTITKDMAEKPSKAEKRENKLMKVTEIINSIILIFMGLHMVIIVHTVSFDIFPSLRVPVMQTVFQCLDYLSSYINSLVCAYMYIWKIQECKMIFMNTFLSWNKRYRDEAEKLRLSVYNIVTNERISDSIKKV